MPPLVAPVLRPDALRHVEQPVLRVDELTVRPWAASDVAAVVAAYAEPSIQRWHLRTMDAAEAASWLTTWSARWAGGRGAGWAVTAAEGVVGQISARRLSLSAGTAEVSYWVLPDARGRAIAPRVLRAVTGWLLHELGLHRIELAHSTENPSSCRVAAKAGYLLEGTKRSQALHTDGWHDMHLHACVRGDDAGFE